MAIWRFLKWRSSAIFDLWNSNFSKVAELKRPILHQRPKFRKDRSNRCWDTAIFVIFRSAAAAILDFPLTKPVAVNTVLALTRAARDVFSVTRRVDEMLPVHCECSWWQLGGVTKCSSSQYVPIAGDRRCRQQPDYSVVYGRWSGTAVVGSGPWCTLRCRESHHSYARSQRRKL